MNAIVKFEAVTDLASHYGMGPEALIHTMQAVAMPKPHSDEELMSCLLVAREHGLNPLTKEIYFMRSRGGPIQPIVSVDGWMRKCNEHPQFDGVEFEPEKDDKGEVIALTCRMYRKDRNRPVVVTEYLAECKAAGGPVWKTNPMRMLRNRTYCQAARMAFGFAGIMEPDEYRQWQAQGEPIDLSPDTISVHDAFELQTLSPRDGGPLVLRGEPVQRGSSSAFKDTGGADRFNALQAQLAECVTIEDLHKAYDAFERQGMPWADFPTGWAKLLHADYCLALEELSGMGEPVVSPVDAIGHAIENAASADALGAIFREHFDRVPWGSVDDRFREDLQEAYDAKMAELGEAAA